MKYADGTLYEEDWKNGYREEARVIIFYKCYSVVVDLLLGN